MGAGAWRVLDLRWPQHCPAQHWWPPGPPGPREPLMESPGPDLTVPSHATVTTCPRPQAVREGPSGGCGQAAGQQGQHHGQEREPLADDPYTSLPRRRSWGSLTAGSSGGSHSSRGPEPLGVRVSIKCSVPQFMLADARRGGRGACEGRKGRAAGWERVTGPLPDSPLPGATSSSSRGYYRASVWLRAPPPGSSPSAGPGSRGAEGRDPSYSFFFLLCFFGSRPAVLKGFS